jgi:hypothetical protein
MIRMFRITLGLLSAFGLASLLACGGGGGSSSPAPTPTPTVTSVTVSPNPGSVNLNSGSTLQFTATVNGTGSYSSAVTWSASSGSVNSSGLYTAPATPGNYTVTATSVQDASKSGTATVNVTKPFADTLVYTNPTSGTYQLLKNTAKSTATHLVLDLVGPAGSLSGVGFYLSADQTKVTWTTVDIGDPEKVKSTTFSTTIVKSKVSGDTLQAGVYQKGTTAALAATTSTVLASVALDLKSSVAYGSNANLAAVAGKAQILSAPGVNPPTPAIAITVGTLTAN